MVSLYHVRKFNVCDFSEGGGFEDQAEYFCQENSDYNFLHINLIVGTEFPPKDTKFNQDYFIDTVLPNLYSEKRPIARRKGIPSFSVHMDNLTCHNGAKITEKLEKRDIARAPHPLYLPDLCPCDFWDLEAEDEGASFQNEEQSLAAITWSWNEATFEDIQRVFHNWTERLNG
jgi:hypothetical protein